MDGHENHVRPMKPLSKLSFALGIDNLGRNKPRTVNPHFETQGKSLLFKKPEESRSGPEGILHLLDPPILKSSYHRTFQLYGPINSLFYPRQFESCFCTYDQKSWPIASSQSPDLFISLAVLTASFSERGTKLVCIIFLLCLIFVWDLVLSISLSPLTSFPGPLFITGIGWKSVIRLFQKSFLKM